MTGKLGHQITDDGVTVVYRAEAAPPVTLRLTENEAKRFAWSLLADIDPDSTLGEDGAEVVEYGPLILDCGKVTATFKGQPIHLTTAEWKVVRLLASRGGRLCNRQAVIDELYSGRGERDPKIVDVYICKIRNKLRAVGGDGYLESEWGKGYRLVEVPYQNAIPSRERSRPNNWDIGATIRLNLAEKPATFLELCAINPAWNPGSVRASLNVMMAKGVVVNTGAPRRAVYRLRDPKVIVPFEGEGR